MTSGLKSQDFQSITPICNMAAQDVGPIVPSAGEYEPRNNEVHGSSDDEEMQSRSDDNTLHERSDSEDSVTKERPEKTVAAVDVHRMDSLRSDKPLPTPTHRTWKVRVMQFKPFSHLAAYQSEKPRPWRTTLTRFGPLSGIFCMLLAFAGTVASLGILAGSDGQSVASWAVTPSTYIAIFTAISNLSMRYAAIQGVVIAWWYKALKGSTLASLHWDWRSGTTLRGALTAGRHMG